MGVCLDHRRKFQVHVEEISIKCARVVGSLGRLMADVYGRPSKTKILATVLESLASTQFQSG